MEHADIIIMCSHGDTGLKRWAFHSFALQMSRQSAVPIVILNEHGTDIPVPNPASPLRALVPLDGTPFSEAALLPTAQLLATLSGSLPCELVLLRVVKSTTIDPAEAKHALEAAKQRLLDRMPAPTLIRVRCLVVVGDDIPETILEQARPEGLDVILEGCDLIAVAAHGREGLARLFKGSITEYLLGYTPLPLLVIRPPREQAAETKEKTHSTGQ